MSAPLSNPLAALRISGVLPVYQLGPFTSMRSELAAPFEMTEEQQFIQADNERHEQALHFAICEMLSDLVRVPDDRKAYARWCKAVDAKAFEIFSRLN